MDLIKYLRWLTRSENSRNQKTKGYFLYYSKPRKLYRLRWRLCLENKKEKNKFFKTREEAQEFADNYNFPLAKNYNVEF